MVCPSVSVSVNVTVPDALLALSTGTRKTVATKSRNTSRACVWARTARMLAIRANISVTIVSRCPASSDHPGTCSSPHAAASSAS
jgi:hypothetical protein